MVTRMTDEGWAMVLEVFAAACSRRGDKGRNDRRFLEALPFFTLHTITWRSLPAEFAGLSRTAHLVQMFDATGVRAHVSAAGAKGGRTRRLWAAHAGASQPRSTGRPTLTAIRLAST